LSVELPKHLFARDYKLFDVDGSTVLFNCQTTQISEVHQIIFDTIKACDGRPTQDIIRDLTQEHCLDDVTEAIRELRSVKLVVGNQRKYVYRPRKEQGRRPDISFISLNVAEDCNLRCKYCYVSHGDFSGVRRMMTRDVAKSAIDYLVLVSGEQKMCQVNFFGGEPLLNFDLIRWCTHYAKRVLSDAGKGVRFDLSTNGTLVTDEIIRFFEEHDFRVQVSLDGPADIHDVQRPFADGSGSHDIAVEAIHHLREAGVTVGTATVVCGNDLSACRAFHYVHGMGGSNVQITLSQIPGNPEWGFTEDQMDTVREQFGTLADEYFSSLIHDTPVRNALFEKVLRRIRNGFPAIRSCSAGQTMMAVGANGSIYPCSLVVGIEELNMGSVFSPPPPEALPNPFAGFDANSVRACQDCWARYVCSGGCPATWVRVSQYLMETNPLICDFSTSLIAMAVKGYAKVKLNRAESARNNEQLAKTANDDKNDFPNCS